jgi:hypothetical protein
MMRRLPRFLRGRVDASTLTALLRLGLIPGLWLTVFGVVGSIVANPVPTAFAAANVIGLIATFAAYVVVAIEGFRD